MLQEVELQLWGSDHNRDSVLELLPYRTLMEKVCSVLSAWQIIVTCILKLIYKI